MQHRHLNHEKLTPAAVDDIIRRGGWQDWVALRRAAREDRAVQDRIFRICERAAQNRDSEGGQRLTFWRKYVERLTATVG
jgi:hypothetical protein